jgi:hypothetical protein
MTDWYRRTVWDDEIAADFEARLARSRPSSRPQYLSLQGYALLGSHPEIAEELLSRVVASGEASELPRAACYLALSRVAQGNVTDAIEAYEIAIEAERENPAFRSTAGVDQAFLIALDGRSELFGKALDQLAMAAADDWSMAGFEAVVAEALLRHARGENARDRAIEALALFPVGADSAEWAGISLGDLRARLEAIAR